MKSSNVMPDGGCMSIMAYARAVTEGTADTPLQTPPQVSAALRAYADEAMALVDTAESTGMAADTAAAERELRCVLADQRSMAWLGRYYAGKIDAAVAMQRFALTGDESFRGEAIALLKECVVHWKEYAALYGAQYKPQQLARHGWLDIPALTAQVEKDIVLAESYIRC